jgi:hypothetical protein
MSSGVISLISLFDSWPQVRTLLARELLPTCGGKAAARILRTRVHHFVFAPRARCFLAAFILSTRLGYLRPAFFARCLAAALLFGVNLVWRLFFGGAFSQGSLEDEVLDMPRIRARPRAWFYRRLAFVSSCLGDVFFDGLDRCFYRWANQPR